MLTRLGWLKVAIPLFLCVAAAAQVRLITLDKFPFEQGPSSGPTQLAGGDYVAGLAGPDRIARMTPGGALSTVYTLAADGSQGSGVNTLIQGSDGNLYGTCSYGGANSDGTVFKLTLDGHFTLLYTFQGSDGRQPAGRLVEGDDGALYGVTSFGGPNDAGTIFRIGRTGLFTSLFAFNGSTTGDNVNGGLILASDGNFYGTTFAGGTNPYGAGTVFKISPQGNFTSVYSLDGIDGYFPNGPVLEASDANFYGTATFGGQFDFGVVYRLTPSGEYTVVASFDDNSNGADPFGALIEGSDGSLYGITDLEYYYLGGTAFQLTPSGSLTTLATFGEGDQVFDGLLQAEGGGIRGNTDGIAFAIRLGIPEPLPSIAHFRPAIGEAGTVVTLRGDHFAYACEVRFNGVKAAFRTTSANFIEAIVPWGATTGPVSVRNLGGTKQTTTPFTVTR